MDIYMILEVVDLIGVYFNIVCLYEELNLIFKFKCNINGYCIFNDFYIE